MNVPPKEFIRVAPAQLRALATDLLEAAGSPTADAEVIAHLLVDTDLRGVLSHGTRLAREYANCLRDGQLNPRPEVRVVRQDSTTALVDGDGGLGHLAARQATQLAIDKAYVSGVAAACSRNHGHFGSAGKYTRMVVAAGLTGFCVSGHPMRRLTHEKSEWNPFGCPPMSFAFPAGKGPPVHLDMGTSWFSSAERDEWFARSPAPFFKSLGLVAVAHLFGGAMPGMMQAAFQPPHRSYPRAAYGAFVLAVKRGALHSPRGVPRRGGRDCAAGPRGPSVSGAGALRIAGRPGVGARACVVSRGDPPGTGAPGEPRGDRQGAGRAGPLAVEPGAQMMLSGG